MKKGTTFIALILALFYLSVYSVLAETEANEVPWKKYPDNSSMNFKDADSFYQSLDKEKYVEFDNAKLNIREKSYFKDANKVLSKADKYSKTRIGGDGYHPNRQVYVFVTVNQEGKMVTAVFDAETKRKISWTSDIAEEP